MPVITPPFSKRHADLTDVSTPHVSGDLSQCLQFIETKTLTGNASTITFSNLNMDGVAGYYFLIHTVSNVTGTNDVSLFFNGDTTATNYYTDVGADNNAIILVDDSSVTGSGFNLMGNLLCSKLSGRQPATNVGVFAVAGNKTQHRWTSTANVTSMTLSSSSVNGFGIGSKFTLYKLT
jgi:hypothetical protein